MINNTKILIIGTDNIDKLSLAKKLITKNDDLSIAYTFYSDKQYNNEQESDNYIYYLSNDEVNLSFKNNALLYVYNFDNGSEYISKGITTDSFYNDDIFCMNISDFNNISEHIFKNTPLLIIWLDTKFQSNNKQLSSDILETKYLTERLEYIKYLYFIDEDYDNVASTILEYLESDEARQTEILEENS